MSRFSFLLTAGFVAVIIILSCENSSNEFNKENWQKELQAHREKTDEEYSSAPDSPFAGLKRFTLDTISDHYISINNGEFDLQNENTPESVFGIGFNNGHWNWQKTKPGFQLQANGKQINPGVIAEKDISGTYGRYYFSIYPLDERMIIIVFDPDREAIKQFKHLRYFAPNPEYRVIAKLEHFNNPEKVQMLTSRNLIKTYYRYAKVRFKINGQDQILMAYKQKPQREPGKSWLFIPFKDKTTGVETYAAGRFLEIKEPEGEQFVLDFNRAFNPLCNYAHVYNCSYPPPENWLDIPINAGEKTYPESTKIEH